MGEYQLIAEPNGKSRIAEVKREMPTQDKNKVDESPFPKVGSTEEVFWKCLFCGEKFNTPNLRLHLKYEEGLEW